MVSAGPGEVVVPTARRLGLFASKLHGLASLKELGPNDVEALEVSYARRDGDPAGLGPIGRLTGLKSLSLAGPFTNSDLADLAGLERLTQLNLDSKTLDETGIAHIAKLKSIERLRFITHEPVTENTFAHLATLPSLKELTICWKKGRLEGLERLTSLEGLDLTPWWSDETPTVSPDRLETLSSLKWLRFSYPDQGAEGPLVQLGGSAKGRFEQYAGVGQSF